MSRIKIALIGCGRVSLKHVQAITENPAAELVAVCDHQASRLQAMASICSIPMFHDYHTMLTSTHPDIVSILTESGAHAAIGIQIASQYKKHLIVEKPMALTLEDADALITAVEKVSRKLFVVKQNRYNLPVRRLKNALDGGRFGKLVMGTVRVRWSRDQRYYDQDPWRGTWALDGGIFANQASHHIDLLQWLMGPVVRVFARNATRLHDIETDDTGVAVLGFENGALGVIEATTCARPVDLEGSISILGEKGAVEIAGYAANAIKTWNFIEKNDEDASAIDDYSYVTPDVYGLGHKGFYRDVIDALNDRNVDVTDGFEGRKSLEIIRAIYESVRTGQEVFLREYLVDKAHRY